MLNTSSAPASSTIADILLMDTDGATATLGPSLRENYRVHTAGTKELALQQLGRFSPVLVIVDLELDRTAALDICRLAKALPIPATVLVTTTDVAGVPGALDAGCDGVLLKPFALNLLHARIGRLLRGRSTTRSAAHAGTNREWPDDLCPNCGHQGVTSFEFSSHRRSWYACLACKTVWMGKRQE